MVGVPKSLSGLQTAFNALFASNQGPGAITPPRVLQGMLDLVSSTRQNAASLNLDALAAAPTGQTAQFFPSDLGWYKVTDYGAVGDGVEDANGNLVGGWTDNLTAFQSAFSAAVTYWKASAIFCPGPTLLIVGSTNPATPKIFVLSNSFRYATDGAQGTAWQSGVTIQGSGYFKIRLADYTFQDPTNPQPVLWMASQPAQGSNSAGAGNSAFYNYLFDLIIDVGVGNPGAGGIGYMGNNISGMENVVIRSNDPLHLGYAGIFDMGRYAPGPSLFKNVLIDGFSHGIVNTQADYSLTISGITFINQLVDIIVNASQMTSIEGITCPAGMSMTVNVDGLVVNADKPTSQFTLAVQKMPNPAIITSPTSTDYYSVITAGADKTGVADSTAAIQSAIDSGHAIVYMPFGFYKTTDTLILRGSLRRLMMCGSAIVPDTTSFGRTGSVIANFSLSDGAFSAPGGTWNPSDKAALINLSNGNLTATGDNTVVSANYYNVRGTVGKSSGKWKYSYTVNFNSHNQAGEGNWGVGFGTASANLGGNPSDYLGNVGSFAYYASTGRIFSNNVELFPAIEAAPVGCTVDVYVDYTNKLVWIRPSASFGGSGKWNNDVSANQNPLTPVGGISFSALSGTMYPMFDTGFDGGGTAIRPALKFSGTVDCLVDRGIIWGAGAAVSFEHNSALQLSLRHMETNHNFVGNEGFYRNSTSGTGNLFLEDIAHGSQFSVQGADMAILHPQNVWARQLNPEQWSTKVLNAGGNLWVLGLKTEVPGTCIKTTTGGRTEVLGYYLYPLRQDSTAAAFEHTDTATGSYAGMTQAYVVNFDYDTILLTPGKTIVHSQLPTRNYGTRAPMGIVFG